MRTRWEASPIGRTWLRGVLICALVVGTFATAPAAAEELPVDPLGITADSPSNLLRNGGAEDGVAGWVAAGFASVAYGSSPQVPAAAFASANQVGAHAFVAMTPGATLTQVIPVDPSIETYSLSIAGLFGGAGSSADGAAMTAQPQDASGDPIGAPTQLGPVTPQDRGDATTLRVCEASLYPLPEGMRSVRITVQAIGTFDGQGSAVADSLTVEPQPLVVPRASASATFYFREPLQGPNCIREVPRNIDPPPGPTQPPLPPGPRQPPLPSPDKTKPSRRARLSAIVLRKHRLSLRTSGAAAIRIVVYKQVARAARRPARRTSWRRELTLQRTLTRAGEIRYRLRRPLANGRYRVTAVATTVQGAKKRVAVIRLIPARK